LPAKLNSEKFVLRDEAQGVRNAKPARTEVVRKGLSTAATPRFARKTDFPIKKPLDSSKGSYLAAGASEESKNVFRHQSPERLVRMMVVVMAQVAENHDSWFKVMTQGVVA
jgi:hypothetical protein